MIRSGLSFAAAIGTISLATSSFAQPASSPQPSSPQPSSPQPSAAQTGDGSNPTQPSWAAQPPTQPRAQGSATTPGEAPPQPGAPTLPSETRTAKNTIFVELLGNGGLYSINYDRWVHENVTLRVGLSYFAFGASSGSESTRFSLTTAPIMVNYLVGSPSHKFEAGAGVILAYATGSSSSGTSSSFAEGVGLAGTATLGYRYSAPDGGFVFRAGFTPLVGRGGFLPWFGVSFGYGF